MAEPTRLTAGTEDELAESLESLAPGQTGWISFLEAQRLFSPLDEGDDMALTEFDVNGLTNLGTFAAGFAIARRTRGA
jgi:hypothetical protein